MIRLLAALLLALCAPAAEVELQRVRVQPGDTLWSLSQRYLQDPKRWNEILQYNKLPGDPTIALPGKTLLVPKELIKEDLRSAALEIVVRDVLSRKKDTADWKDALVQDDLYHGDSLRTLSESRARVRFYGGGRLSVDPNSMAILKAPKKEDHDIRLMSGSVHAARTRVATPSALITPKGEGSRFSARVNQDLSTSVQVFEGAAEVKGTGRTVEVKAGDYTKVPVGEGPTRPARIPNFGRLQTQVAQAEAAAPEPIVIVRRIPRTPAAPAPEEIDLSNPEPGMPVAAYRVQASRTQDFTKPAYEKVYDVEEKVDLAAAGLRGRYWVRAAPIDLLGTQEPFSPPRQVEVLPPAR